MKHQNNNVTVYTKPQSESYYQKQDSLFYLKNYKILDKVPLSLEANPTMTTDREIAIHTQPSYEGYAYSLLGSPHENVQVRLYGPIRVT